MKSPIPRYLIFFATTRCNMKCVHCFYWKELNKASGELTLSEIEKVAGFLKGLFFLRITGGEPFIREDLPGVIRAFYKHAHTRRIGLSTNGFLTERIETAVKSVVEELKDLRLEIGISVDGTRQRHDESRACAGAYEHAMRTYDRLAGIRGETSNLKVGFLMTMMKDNQDDMAGLFDILAEKKPDSIGCNLVRGHIRDSSQLDVDIEKYDKIQGLLGAYNRGRSSKNDFIQGLRLAKSSISHQYIMNIFRSKSRQLDCLAGDKIAVLYPNGDVSACELLNDTIGNIKNSNYDFRTLWRSKARGGLIKKIKDSGCFCTHECFITANMIFSPREQLKIFSQWAFK